MGRRGLALLALAVVAVLFPLRAALGAGGVHSLDDYLVGKGTPLGSQTPQAVHQNQGLPVPMILGYFYAPYGQGLQSLENYKGVLNGIVPFWYTIHPDGSITGSSDQAVIQMAAKRHMWVFALVQNMTGASVYHALFTNPVTKERALQSLLALVETQGYDGLNLDFEGIAPSDRGRFDAFVQELSMLLHENGYYLTLSLPAETQDSPNDSWTGAYDYTFLGHWADLIMIMAYDEHYSGGTAGPVAGPAWVADVTKYAAKVVPPQKLVLGIPAYGYDWGGGQGKAITYAQWKQLLSHYAGSSTVPGHLEYYLNGVLHDVYFEDRQAMEQSVQLAVGYNLRGIVLWRLGIEDPTIWQFVHS